MIAIIDAYRSGLLNIKYWWPNLLSGTLVGIVALPLAMAFAIASGLSPQQGIYTAIVAAIITGIFGGTRTQISGPTGAFVVILAGIVAKYGIAGLQFASLIAGVILLLMGFLKLGSVIKFVPTPVIIGFTTGIGVIIFVGEWKDFFGLSLTLPLNVNFIQKLIALVTAFPTANLPTTALAILSLLLVVFSSKVLKKVPGPLVAMIVVTGLQMVFQFKQVETIGSAFGIIAQKLPELHWPSVPLGHAFDLIGSAFTIALLGAIESLLSASAADTMAGTRHQANQELVGQGLANLVTPLLGGFAATGAIARTATNIKNGGSSPLAALVHSAFLILVVLFLAPVVSQTPLCVLAAILFVVSYNMSDFPHFLHTLKVAPRYDAIILLVTCLLTIFTNLVIAVYVGMTLSLLCFLQRTNQHTTIYSHKESTSPSQSETEKTALALLPQDTIVYFLEGPFFFGTARKIEQTLSIIQTVPRCVILRFKEVPFIDATGLLTLKTIIQRYQAQQVKVYLCEASPLVSNKLIKAGILAMLPNQTITNAFLEVVSNLS